MSTAYSSSDMSELDVFLPLRIKYSYTSIQNRSWKKRSIDDGGTIMDLINLTVISFVSQPMTSVSNYELEMEYVSMPFSKNSQQDNAPN